MPGTGMGQNGSHVLMRLTLTLPPRRIFPFLCGLNPTRRGIRARISIWLIKKSGQAMGYISTPRDSLFSVLIPTERGHLPIPLQQPWTFMMVPTGITLWQLKEEHPELIFT